MPVIKVPKTPRKAFDPSRRPSSLLLKQIEHLEWAALPASQRKPNQLPKQKVKTEGQAADRVGQLTQMVVEAAKAARPSDGVPAAPAARVTLPPLPPHPARAKKPSPVSAPRKRRKTAKRS
jgi:hypothetical protein